MGKMDLARVFSRVHLPRQSVSDGSQAQTRGRQSHAEAGANNFLPMWTKPAEVIGDYVSLQSKEWTGCPGC